MRVDGKLIAYPGSEVT